MASVSPVYQQGRLFISRLEKTALNGAGLHLDFAQDKAIAEKKVERRVNLLQQSCLTDQDQDK